MSKPGTSLQWISWLIVFAAVTIVHAQQPATPPAARPAAPAGLIGMAAILGGARAEERAAQR